MKDEPSGRILPSTAVSSALYASTSARRPSSSTGTCPRVAARRSSPGSARWARGVGRQVRVVGAARSRRCPVSTSLKRSARAGAASTGSETPACRPCSRRLQWSALKFAGIATSSRRSPGTRRVPGNASIPACAGVSRSRRARRKAPKAQRSWLIPSRYGLARETAWSCRAQAGSELVATRACRVKRGHDLDTTRMAARISALFPRTPPPRWTTPISRRRSRSTSAHRTSWSPSPHPPWHSRAARQRVSGSAGQRVSGSAGQRVSGSAGRSDHGWPRWEARSPRSTPPPRPPTSS
jgi:hypothetical protein